jgi:nucleoside-diphosphate-sugar epimerase
MSTTDAGVALVTGGAGFIGSHLCARLAAAGMVVHSASRREHPGTPQMRHWRADLADFAAVDELVRRIRPDYVFHLASHVMGSPDRSQVLPTFHGNLHTTVNLLTSLAERGCRRFVMAGSFMEPSAQAGEMVPTSPYAASKWASAGYIRMFRSLYGLPVTTARVFMVYGPGQQDRTKLVPYAVRTLLKGEPPAISSGRRLVDWIYVEDVADGLLRLAQAPDIDGETVDLGSGSMIATVDLVEKICRLARPGLRPQVGALPDRPMEPTGAANVERTRSLIEWVPRVDLDEGLWRTIDSIRTEGEGG